ncbi:tryptophan-rich sensory protein [Rhodococcus pyridinivorans]|uniref:Tryptophan-rich sensory protein n=1 Tax=Rhodococcus pyridinivorans AK37 TaxID=1114960 RepID=H0JU33_9NOCA|nr:MULTISPECIES: TspO/MBR family protein [Rhodococcus]AWZ22975.1 tryptophan-rich sensory protein [Rhodococcus pyridinivorans]EHK82352.1 tryptophan-rich sensory protein [Rhodococcus pyridinivorans AK37]MCD2143045.1 tryptophan-rich sensory protein [Rhodococcus pyridinivorans]MCW3469226.1 tryptophan-rich sensory protein [Rhodococcus pyridinivorans]OBA33446.1 TspO protein [Rhodococcus sp. 852002-51564_SCH6189132-a]
MRLSTVLATAAATTTTAIVGSIASQDTDSRWYRKLRKPGFQPPAAAFPIVWTALYADIAVTSAVAIDEYTDADDYAGRRNYIAALATNLVLNASWSWVFFKWHRLMPATVVAALLAASTADLTRRTAEANPAAGAALAPYSAWTAFATLLTGRIAQLNR